jgi:hypothetical protein
MEKLTDEIGHATLTDIKFVKQIVTILYLVQTLKQNRMFTLWYYTTGVLKNIIIFYLFDKV